MKAMLAVIALALGLVLGFTAGMLIRDPEVVTNPSTLLPEDAPDACLEVIESAEELSQITSEYLSLVRDTYLPVIEQYAQDATLAPETAIPSPPQSEIPVVDELLAAEQQLADLSDRTVAAIASFNEAKVVCRTRVRE